MQNLDPVTPTITGPVPAASPSSPALDPDSSQPGADQAKTLVEIPLAGPVGAPPPSSSNRQESQRQPPAAVSSIATPDPSPGLPAALGAGSSPAAEAPRNEFQRLLDEVETGFDAIFDTNEASAILARAPSDRTPPAEHVITPEFDETQARQLFDDLVAASAQPIRDFMIEIRLGEPHSAWVTYCEPSMRAVIRSSEAMGYPELTSRAQRFLDALETTRAANQPVVRHEARQRLIDTYSELIAFFPEAFGVEEEANRRETLIVHGLLSKVMGLQKVGLDRLFATGMVSLGLFYVSRPKDLSDLASLPLDVAERIVERFKEYRNLASELSPIKGRKAERERIKQLIESLARTSAGYDQSAPVSAERRVRRRERHLIMNDLYIALARLGEVARADTLRTLSFDARVHALQSFLEEAERKSLLEQSTQ